MSDKFSYTYSAPGKGERREIENIRQQYSQYKGEKATVDVDKEEALNLLKSFLRRVGTFPKAVAIIIAVIGTLIFGTGMALTLEWENFILGVPIGIVGIVILCFIVFIHRLLLKRSQKKYGAQIVALCDKLLNEEKK